MSFGKSFLWLLLVWALAPFLVWFAVFSWRNANLAGGFAGRRGWCPCLFSSLFDLLTFMDSIGPCTNVFSTAYAHVRTEPQSNIGQTRGKKRLHRSLFVEGIRPHEEPYKQKYHNCSNLIFGAASTLAFGLLEVVLSSCVESFLLTKPNFDYLRNVKRRPCACPMEAQGSLD